jgi:flagellar motor protein MotB
MYDSKTPLSRRGVTNDQSSVVWFISFGDLLTLLLCFFLVLTPWERLSKPPNAESRQHIKESEQRASAFGTSFASKTRRVSKILAEVPIFEGPGGFIDVARTKEWMFQHVQDAEAVEMSFNICASGPERQKTLEELGRMMNEMDIESTTVAFEVHESCESAAFLAPVTERVVGVVRVSKV